MQKINFLVWRMEEDRSYAEEEETSYAGEEEETPLDIADIGEALQPYRFEPRGPAEAPVHGSRFERDLERCRT